MRIIRHFWWTTIIVLMACISSFAQEFIIAGMGVMPKAWDKEANYATLERYARDAAGQGAKMVVTPEGF